MAGQRRIGRSGGLHSATEGPAEGSGICFGVALAAVFAAKLDAARPLVNAATLRVRPVVDGVTADTGSRGPERPQLMAPPRRRRS